LGIAAITPSEVSFDSNTFPNLIFNIDGEEVEDEKTTIIYVWETNMGVFDFYSILRFYLGENYSISPTLSLILRWADDNDLPYLEVLEKITYLHVEYISTLLENRDAG
jgi:hypothetical protein